MTAQVHIVQMCEKVPPVPRQIVLNVCYNRPDFWCSDLSPFKIGPCELYGEFVSENMENAWQFAKVYRCHFDCDGDIDPSYWDWAKRGWADFTAHRYPMGRGAVPKFSLWAGDRLGYIDARKTIYVPLYAEAVMRTKGWQRLKELHESNDMLVLRDFDGYGHVKLGLSLTEVLNNPHRKMGHAFVLAMLLTNDIALKQCELRGPVL